MALAPMMQHYLQTKEKYKDCIVFYRLGDFYEMFFDDAIKASKILDLTLTGRDCGLEERAPMCGVPFHSADSYIATLVQNGEKVAICEQLNQPNGKELVKRDVVRVVTAGTVTNSELIDSRTNNFLGSVYIKDKKVAFSWVDITTGEFFVRNFSSDNSISELLDVLVRVSPVEIISNSQAEELFRQAPLIIHGVLPKFYAFTESEFNLQNAKKSLETQFNVLSLASYNIENDEECICSSGALIAYLKETQRHSLVNITNVKKENVDELMMLDVNAIRNLELTKTLRDNKSYGSLLWLLDKTKTSMGARKLSSWILSPLNSIDKINYRLGGVEAFFNNTLVRQGLTNALGGVRDIARLAGKISNGKLLPRDCLALKNSLEVIPSIKFQLLGLQSQFVLDILSNLSDFSDTVQLLSSAINEKAPATLKEGDYIKEGYNNELDELRKLSRNSRDCIAEIENSEREKTGIKTLKISYNRVFGYYIEITNSFKDKVPFNYIRKQTLTNAERYVTEELKILEEKILSSDEKLAKIEISLFNEIKEFLEARIEDFKLASEQIANLDVLLALATVAKNNSYTRPIIENGRAKLDIVDGRHPVVEAISKQRFVPNDCLLDNDENRTMIITGPNMAGKSTYMRQIALITLLSHIGSFVPAKSASIPLTDKIFTRIGASDNLISDQSTFMVEMSEVASIINNATENSLLILDEIGRGTSTFDGLSIAWAVVEYLTKNIRARTLFATHYHELTELEGLLDGVKNYKVTVKELQGGIVFLRKIMRGGTNRSFGIEVAELAGVDKKVTERAKKILKKLEKSDITKGKTTIYAENDNEQRKSFSETEKIISELDINNLSPIQAFNILNDLYEKIKSE